MNFATQSIEINCLNCNAYNNYVVLCKMAFFLTAQSRALIAETHKADSIVPFKMAFFLFAQLQALIRCNNNIRLNRQHIYRIYQI